MADKPDGRPIRPTMKRIKVCKERPLGPGEEARLEALAALCATATGPALTVIDGGRT